MSDTQREQQNQRFRERHQRLKTQGVCVKCGRNNPVPYTLKCPECSKKEKICKARKRQYNKNHHICTRCGKREAAPDRLRCAECVKKEKIQAAEEYQFFKEHHICVKCRKNKADPDRTLCTECAVKQMGRVQITTEAQKERHSVLAKQRYYDRKARGICAYCGQYKAVKGKTGCMECRLRIKKRTKEKYESKKEFPNLCRNERPLYGMCYICAKPVKEGKRLCEKHYVIARKQAAYAGTFTDRENHIWRKDNGLAFMKRS